MSWFLRLRCSTTLTTNGSDIFPLGLRHVPPPSVRTPLEVSYIVRACFGKVFGANLVYLERNVGTTLLHLLVDPWVADLIYTPHAMAGPFNRRLPGSELVRIWDGDGSEQAGCGFRGLRLCLVYNAFLCNDKLVMCTDLLTLYTIKQTRRSQPK